MRVLLLGAGTMGAQIACEYALAGHGVTVLSRHAETAIQRTEETFGLAEELDLFCSGSIERARTRVRAISALSEADPAYDVIIESLPEDLGLKVKYLREAAEHFPDSILATNTSSLSVTAIGQSVGAPEHTLGTHYWNPPLLMPLVEVVPGEQTDECAVQIVESVLRQLGKRPIRCADVPGFAWNRLQMAVLREALWLAESGVVPPNAIDEILSDGLARRWRNIGFFDAIALGGAETWERAAANLLPELSTADAISDLRAWLNTDQNSLAIAQARRDRGLARELLETRSGAEPPGQTGK